MYYARAFLDGNGTNKVFSVSFPYLDRSHVEVRVGGSLLTPAVDFVWLSSGVVSLTIAPPAGTGNVEIKRTTPRSTVMVDFSDGSTLTESDLDMENLQLLYIVQESLDEAQMKLGLGTDFNWNAFGKRITNLADPVGTLDAVNLRTLLSYIGQLSSDGSGQVVLQMLANGTDETLGDKLLTVTQPFPGAVARSQHEKNADFISFKDSLSGTSSAANDAALAAACTESEMVWVPMGQYPITAASIPFLGKVFGPGSFELAGTLLPAGDVKADLTLPIPSVIPSITVANTYLGSRRISGGKVTYLLAAGVQNYTDNVCPDHPDGVRIQIIGAGSALTTLKFDFAGKQGLGTAAFKLVGQRSLGLLDGVTIDGSNWSGRTGGPPASYSGDSNDPIGILAREGATIHLGPDVIVKDMARNGILTFMNGNIHCNGATVQNCGSDGFVASTAGSTNAKNTKSIGNYGFGYYSDYGGSLWADDSQATDTLKRNGTGGGGYAANFNGTLVARDSQSLRNTGDGYLSLSGTLHIDGSTAGGSAPNANAGSGLRCQAGGQTYAISFNSSYNAINGVNLAQGGGFFGSGLIANNNGADGMYVGVGGFLESGSAFASSNGGMGIKAEYAAAINVPQITCNSNVSHGISCTGSYIASYSVVSVQNNGGYGIQSRFSGVVDLRSSSPSVVTGNTSGNFSPTNNTTTGITDSFIYTTA